jgi:hypothetical protein
LSNELPCPPRLGMMWSGFEPAEGEINETYSDTIKEIVDGLGSRGVYSYLDMHQVVFLYTALKIIFSCLIILHSTHCAHDLKSLNTKQLADYELGLKYIAIMSAIEGRMLGNSGLGEGHTRPTLC